MGVAWRNSLTEGWQTFLFAFAILMSKGDPFVVAACFYATIFGTGNISGSHFNSAATLGCIVRDLIKKDNEKISTYLMYILFQFAGAVAAGLAAWAILGVTLELKVNDDYVMGQWIVIEIIGSYVLAYAIISCGASSPGKLSGGLGPSAAVFMISKFGYVSGGGFNPAIAFGIEIADAMNHGFDRLDHLYIYVGITAFGGILAGLWSFVLVPAIEEKWDADADLDSTFVGQKSKPNKQKTNPEPENPFKGGKNEVAPLTKKGTGGISPQRSPSNKVAAGPQPPRR